MKAFKLLALTSCFLLAAGNGVAQRDYSKSEGLLRYVDPFIGSGYHGHVFVGTSVPYGMVQLGLTISIKAGTGALVIITPTAS